MSQVVRTPKGYTVLFKGRQVGGNVEGVMPSQVYDQMTGRSTTAYQLPAYVGIGLPPITPGLRPGLTVHLRPVGPIVTAPSFTPSKSPLRTRYSLG